MATILELSPLGKKVTYQENYNPQLLFAIPRQLKRDDIGVGSQLEFYGVDIWNGFELSWLNPKGKPVVAIVELIFPCDSLNLIESKTLKLYLNSFSATLFPSVKAVETLIRNDLSQLVEAEVSVNIKELKESNQLNFKEFTGIYLDELDVECDRYTPDPKLLATSSEVVEEELFSHLLKSNCLVTGQPDWASIQITYRGNKINHASLLRYIVSYRNHNGFAEHCIEKVFMDVLRYCQPQHLTIYGRYTRRGGLDINPIRSTEEVAVADYLDTRLWRQ